MSLLAINAEEVSRGQPAGNFPKYRQHKLGFALDILVAGIGLLTDSYDFAIINLVRPSLEDLYPVRGDFSTSWQRSMITASSIFGALIGQLLLGFLADRLGRRRLLLVSNGLTFAGALASACAIDFGESHTGIWAWIICARLIMGVGIGGEYPLSACHTAEHAEPGTSGVRMALVFTLIGLGPVLASSLVYTCQVMDVAPAVIWRLAFAVGSLLSLVSITLRCSFTHHSDPSPPASFPSTRAHLHPIPHLARVRSVCAQLCLGARLEQVQTDAARAAAGGGPIAARPVPRALRIAGEFQPGGSRSQRRVWRWRRPLGCLAAEAGPAGVLAPPGWDNVHVVHVRYRGLRPGHVQPGDTPMHPPMKSGCHPLHPPP